jgi:hypothetical protein
MLHETGAANERDVYRKHPAASDTPSVAAHGAEQRRLSPSIATRFSPRKDLNVNVQPDA